MKTFPIKLFMLFLTLLNFGLLAQIPRTLSYQGLLTDSAGYAVADGQYPLFFSLYEQESGGQSVWDEWQDVVTEDGVFGISLGSVVPFNLAFEKAYWLEIEYNGDVLTPRSEVTASAYSLNTADIPDEIVTAEKIADGNVVRSFNGLTDAVAIAAGNNITLTPQGNTLIIAAGDSLGGGGGNTPWLNVGNGIAFPTGDVGMGTNTPQARVHSHQPANSTRPGFYSVNTEADYAVPAVQPMQFGHWNAGQAAFTERMRITRFGNVGIGTAAPSARLGIENESDDPGLRINQTSTTGFGSALLIDHAQGLSPAAKINAASGGGVGLQVDKDGGSGHAISALHDGSGSVIHARQWGSGAGVSITNRGRAAGNLGSILLDVENINGNYPAVNINNTGDNNEPAIHIDNAAIGEAIEIVHNDNFPGINPAIRVTTDGNPIFSGIVNTTNPGTNSYSAFELQSDVPLRPAFRVTSTGIAGDAGQFRVNNIHVNDNILALTAVNNPNVTDFRFLSAAHYGDTKFRVDGDGRAYSDEGFTGSGADFAEMVEVEGGHRNAEPGDVMVISTAKTRAMAKSSEARSTLVMGIYSTKPGFVGSERVWDAPGAEENKATAYNMRYMKETYNEVPLAVVGIVPCKVSAENGPIRRGDLLVTSSTPGHAMRDDDPRNGTIVGKALGSLSSGTGVIKVLVTLQ